MLGEQLHLQDFETNLAIFLDSFSATIADLTNI